jgi:aspartyl/asparaginyl-tRNA synthetase
MDVASAEEKFICEYSATNRGCEAVIVTGFPRSDAKFYHIQDKNDPSVAERADLLFR